MQKKLDHLQIFRGIAATMVVLYHIERSTEIYYHTTLLNNLFGFGWLGVDGFFVLSGFIMVYVHYHDLMQRKNVKSFYIKRFIRIYPIYWIIAIIYLFIKLYFGGLTFQKDFFYILKSFLLFPQKNYPFLFPAWSLVYECFFYLLFGFCIFLGYRISKYVLLIWLISILIIQNSSNPFSNLIFFSPMNIEFIMGCTIGYLFHIRQDGLKKWAAWILRFGILGFIIAVIAGMNIFHTDGMRHTMVVCLVFGTCSALIILGAALKNSVKTRAFPSPLLLMGESSYTIYLSHQIMIDLIYIPAFNHFPNLNYATLLIIGTLTAVLSILLGILLHKTVEKNLLHLLHKRFVPVKI